LEDLTFYWSHRLLNCSIFYSYIHKQHHDYNVTGIVYWHLFSSVSISAVYSHPIEYLIGNVLPVLAGPKILGIKMHLATLHIWIFFRILKTLSAHSGYLFPWEPFAYIPYGTNGDFHSFHHSHNVGNFGSAFTIWDKVFGTDIEYIVENSYSLNI
jgi:sterol desaturase/sphingolipid hydroxylase (fatty acid hydroxylase superfamily)